MSEPGRFSRAYWYATLFIVGITLPSAVSVYWAFGDGLLAPGNPLALLPASALRTVAALLMCCHQVRRLTLLNSGDRLSASAWSDLALGCLAWCQDLV